MTMTTPTDRLAFAGLAGLAAALLVAGCSSSSHASGGTAGDGGGDSPATGADASVPPDAAGADDGGGSAGADDGGGSAGADAGEPAGEDAASPSGEGGSDGDAAHGATDASSEGGTTANGLSYMIGIKTNGTSTGPAKVQGGSADRSTSPAPRSRRRATSARNATYTNASGAAPLLEVSFPLLSIFGESNDLNDLAKAASGAYDSTYEAMSQALAAWPNKLLSARIGWEFNGNWYAWSNGVGTNATYANYVSAFQHAAKAIRKYNPNALIQWCVAWGQPDPTPYWPGAYDASTNTGGVDVISMDFYQANISQYNNGGKQSTWAMAQSSGDHQPRLDGHLRDDQGRQDRALRVRRGLAQQRGRGQRRGLERRHLDGRVDRVDQRAAGRASSCGPTGATMLRPTTSSPPARTLPSRRRGRKPGRARTSPGAGGRRDSRNSYLAR